MSAVPARRRGNSVGLEEEGAGDEGDGGDDPVACLDLPDEFHFVLLGPLLYY